MTRPGPRRYSLRSEESNEESERKVNTTDKLCGVLIPKPLFEAFRIGAWWDMEILEKRGTNYLVHFEGYGRHEEQEVPFNSMRLRSRKAESSDCHCLICGADVVASAVHPHASRSGSNFSLYSAWYDVKIISKEYKHHLSVCACKFEVKFYNECPKGIEIESERILLEDTEMEVPIGKIAIMQAAFESSLESIVEETFIFSEKSIRKQWAKDTYTLDLGFLTQKYLHSTTMKENARTTLVKAGYEIPVIDLTTDIIVEEDIEPLMVEDKMRECLKDATTHVEFELDTHPEPNSTTQLEDNMSERLKDVSTPVELDTHTENNSRAQLVDSIMRQDDLFMRTSCSARGFSGDSCGENKSAHGKGRKRTRISLPRKAKVINGGVYAVGLKHARRTEDRNFFLCCSSDESSSSYRFSSIGSDCDESHDSEHDSEHTYEQEDYATDHSLSRSTPVFYGNMGKSSESTEILFEGKSKSTEIFYEDEDKEHSESVSTRTFYGNTGKDNKNSNSTEERSGCHSKNGGIGCCETEERSGCHCNNIQISSDCSHNVLCRACEYLGVETSTPSSMPASSQGESSNDSIKMPVNCGRNTDTTHLDSEHQFKVSIKAVEIKRMQCIKRPNSEQTKPNAIDGKEKKAKKEKGKDDSIKMPVNCGRNIDMTHSDSEHQSKVSRKVDETKIMQYIKRPNSEQTEPDAISGKEKKAKKSTLQPRSAIPRSRSKASFSRVQEGKKDFNDLFETILKGVRELRRVKGRISSEQVLSTEDQVPWHPIIFHEKEDSVSNLEATVEDDPLKGMWGDMESAFDEMKMHEMGVETPPQQYDQPRKEDEASDCEHYLVLIEEEGYVCSYCRLLVTSIENILPPIKEDKVRRTDRDDKTENEVDAFEAAFNASKEHQKISRKPLKTNVDSVWRLIPELKAQMHKNQIDGFSFLWENIGALSSQNNDEGGGCIIAHAPGTGKSLLIISFLKSFLLLNSWCRPLIVAPKFMLPQWEREFKKWKADIKVHLLQSDRPSPFNYLKIISEWQNSTSVLIVTYQLFSKLTDEERACRNPEIERMGSLLLHIPDIVILDEGHMARNCSKMRESLLQVRTRFKILMSGTLFQNNFRELFNLLYLARPYFLNYLQACSRNKSSEEAAMGDPNRQWQSFEDFESERWRRTIPDQAEVRSRSIFMEEIGNKLEVNVEKTEGDEFKSAIEKLRAITVPFIHFYDGEILNALPGIKEFIVVLQATPLQLSLSTQIKRQDYLETSLSVHPSIFLKWPAMKDCTFLDINELKALRGDASQGPKVKFILDLANFCQALKEELLIFSQYVETLELLQEMLRKKFKVVVIKGRNSRLEDRQRVIDTFNQSEGSLILLASLTACGEGINLTGASRVVFLDMHWNPARMKQAVARAFRIGQRRVVYVYWLISSMEKEANKFMRIQRKDSHSRSIFSSGIKEVLESQLKESNSNVEGEDIILDQLLKNDSSKSILKVVNYSTLERGKLSAFLEHYAFSGRHHTYRLC